MPIIHEDAQMRDAFAGTTFPLEDIYYVGELLLRPAYRNCGLGRKLLDLFENHIRSLGRYHTFTCARVITFPLHGSSPVPVLSGSPG